MAKVKIGIMGFGEIGRHIFRICAKEEDVDVAVISDYGQPDILHYLLMAETKWRFKATLENGNFISSGNERARVITGGKPGDVPWDVFDVDFVVDATGSFKTREALGKHLKAGARRVILSTLPEDTIDNIVIMGVNDDKISQSDRIISAGSATTNAASILLKLFHQNFGVDYAMLTTVHSYTSDQPLRDKVGNSFRRSRSAAENIIPNETPSPRWIQHILPELNGKIEGSALNVPIPNGSLLDLTTIFKNPGVTIDDINKVIYKAAADMPKLVEVMEDPIASSDVIGNTHSVVFDVQASMKSPSRMIKTLTWYHQALAQASRIVDVIKKYHNVG